jgi:hypothetical protein
MKKIFQPILMLMLMTPVLIHAQTDSTKDRMALKLGVYYNSDLNYYGRTDSVHSSGIFPILELWLNKHLYINAAPVFTNNKIVGLQYGGAVATAGYTYNNGKSAGHIYFVKPIYKDNSAIVQSSLKAQVAANFTKLTNWINVTLGGDIKFSGNTDFGATAGIDHIIRKQLSPSTVIVIDPSVFVFAGTQQFSESHIEKSNFLFVRGQERTVTEEVQKFSVLAYEFSAPVILSRGKWMGLVTPAYVIPQNVITSGGAMVQNDKPLFYLTAGVKYTF